MIETLQKAILGSEKEMIFSFFFFWKIDIIFDECIRSKGFSIYKENLNTVKIWDSDKS